MTHEQIVSAIVKAVNELEAKTGIPQFMQPEQFEIRGGLPELMEFLVGDDAPRSDLPFHFAGLTVQVDNRVPANEVWIVEPRSEDHVVIPMRPSIL